MSTFNFPVSWADYARTFAKGARVIAMGDAGTVIGHSGNWVHVALDKGGTVFVRSPAEVVAA